MVSDLDRRVPRVQNVQDRSCIINDPIAEEITEIDNIPTLLEHLRSGKYTAEQVTHAYIRRCVYGVAVSVDGDGLLGWTREYGRLTWLVQSCDSSSAGTPCYIPIRILKWLSILINVLLDKCHYGNSVR